ncbi:MAG: ABC transporter permease [Armatimonadetes bacterium]|nr:ABC transporter permease [Armatimonadota bacterium]
MKAFLGRFRQEAVLLVLLAAFVAVAWRLDPTFLTPKVQGTLVKLVLELAVIALPVTLIVITGGIDLSVGASMSLAAVAFGLAAERGTPWPLAAVCALVAGALAGMLNGWIVSRARIHPLIVTLATMSAYFGLAEGISRARPISGFDPAFQSLVAGPLMFFVLALAAAGAALWLSRTVKGQAVFAIGLNEKAARFSAIDVDKIKFWLYTLAGTAAAVAAVSYAARRNTVKADIGHGMELDVVTAIVLGGTSITGGRGTIGGSLLGILIVHEVRQFVSWHWERDEINLIVIGGLLILALVANSAFGKKTDSA